MADERKDGRQTGGEIDLSPLELLAAIARLDLEAALAYDAAATASADPGVRRQLAAFAQDHRDHVDALNRLLEDEGEAIAAAPPGVPVLAGLVKLAGPLGAEALVVTLLGNEQLTNMSYDGALAYEWEAEIEGMLQEFQRDEERHLAWLAERHDEIGGHAAGPHPPEE